MILLINLFILSGYGIFGILVVVFGLLSLAAMIYSYIKGRENGKRFPTTLVITGVVILLILLSRVFFGRTENFVGKADKTANAEEALKSLPRFKGKKLYLYSTVTFYDDGRIYAKVEDPDKPGNIDDYFYQQHPAGGTWDSVRPYKLDKIDSPLSNGLFPLDSFSFAVGSKIVATYNAKAASVGSSDKLDMVEYQHYTAEGHWKYETKINGGDARHNVEYKILFNDDGSLKYLGEPNGWNFFNDSAGMKKAEADLKNLPAFKGKKLFFIYSIRFQGDHIFTKLQDPAHPKAMLDYYYFSGEWIKESKFEYDDDDEVNYRLSHLFPLDSVSFVTASRIANAYAKYARQVKSSTITLDSLAAEASGNHFIWKYNPVIQGADGKQYVIKFNHDGSLNGFGAK